MKEHRQTKQAEQPDSKVYEFLCEINATSIINEFAVWRNLENALLSSMFAGFDNRLRHILRLHRLDIQVAMTRYVDESGNIDY